MSPENARRHLAILAHAEGDLVVLGAIGFAAQVTDECRAYRELVADRDALDALKSDLVALAATGTPVARIYAALLLRAVDEPAANRALQAMTSSDAPCAITYGGCVVPTGTLGETARALLEGVT
jgi:hypothetical protein